MIDIEGYCGIPTFCLDSPVSCKAWRYIKLAPRKSIDRSGDEGYQNDEQPSENGRPVGGRECWGQVVNFVTSARIPCGDRLFSTQVLLLAGDNVNLSGSCLLLVDPIEAWKLDMIRRPLRGSLVAGSRFPGCLDVEYGLAAPCFHCCLQDVRIMSCFQITPCVRSQHPVKDTLGQWGFAV